MPDICDVEEGDVVSKGAEPLNGAGDVVSLVTFEPELESRMKEDIATLLCTLVELIPRSELAPEPIFGPLPVSEPRRLVAIMDCKLGSKFAVDVA